MKKVICLILSVLLVFSLAACGKNNETKNPTDDDIEIEMPSEDEYVPDEQNFDMGTIWTLKDDISIGDLNLTKKTIEINGEKIDAYTSEIASINEEDLIKQLNEDDYFSCGGETTYSSTREEYHRLNNTDENNSLAIITNKFSIDNGHSDQAQISISWEQIKYHEETPNALRVYYRAAADNVNQEEIYTLMKQLVPNIAEYVVYGKDADSEDPYNMDVTYSGDQYSYTIKREAEGSDYGCFFSFMIYVYNGQQDLFSNNLQDETECFNEPGVKFSDVLAENVPNLSPIDESYKEFAKQLLGRLFPDYAYASITNWYHVDAYLFSENNPMYDRSVAVCVFDENNLSIAEFEYFIRQTLLPDGSTQFNIVEFRILSYDALEKGNATNDKFKSAMTSILKDFTVEEMSLDENNSNKYVGDAKMKIGDHEISGYFAIETDSATRMTIYLS